MNKTHLRYLKYLLLVIASMVAGYARFPFRDVSAQALVIAVIFAPIITSLLYWIEAELPEEKNT